MNTKTHSKAFTMMELIFVIVIMGILAKFGVEFLAQAYSGFINSKINNELQSNSATALEFVATRLQYRIKASTIARENNGTFAPLIDYANQSANILEWVGADIDGFRGDSNPHWSGVIDLNNTKTNLVKITSPRTNTANIDALIKVLENNTSGGIVNAAIYFVNPDSLADNWGWDGNTSKFDTQVGIININENGNAIHPIKASAAPTEFLPVDSNGNDNNFSGVEAYEFYQLAWTAYAVGIDDYNASINSGNLTLWYDYQPWRGENYKDDGKKSIIMQNVSSFRFVARDSIVKIQVCIKSLLLTNEEYSLCKEKTVF